MKHPPSSRYVRTGADFLDGVTAFNGTGNNDFPTKVISYRGSVYVVPDWSVYHDPGDEDDGESKAVLRALRKCPVCNGVLQGGAYCPRCKEYHD